MKKYRNVRLVGEIAVCFLLMAMTGGVMERLAKALGNDGLWVGVLAYFSAGLIIILYWIKAEKSPVSSLGLLKPLVSDIPIGLLLGLFMFLVQQIPLLLLGMDYSQLAARPDWGLVFIMSVYCFVCVGFVEELMFRGFILIKTQELCRLKSAAVIINILLFYAFHWPPVRFVFGEFFNIAVNTLILCAFFYKSKRKSLVPLMIAHGFYDILSGYLLPVFLFYRGQ